jgi:cardiolipin synthase
LQRFPAERPIVRNRLQHLARSRALRLGAVVVTLLALGAVVMASRGTRRPDSLPSLTVDDPAFAPTVAGHTDAAVVGGNALEVLLNGERIFPAKLAAIRGARRTIDYAEYFYADGAIAGQVADALAERCRAGVRANVLLDGVGSLNMPAEHARRMTEAGCRLVMFRPVGRVSLRRHNNRNHRRMLVIDGRLGMTGGSGVSEKWAGDGRTEGHWRDTDARIEGPAVAQLQSAFAENWREATGEVLGGTAYFPPASTAAGDLRLQVVRSSAVSGSEAVYRMYLLAIASARRSIHLTNPYFLPDDRMEQALVDAARRGVRVVALTPGKIDHDLVRSASRRRFGRLLLAGIEILEYQAALLHAKTMVVDGVWATLGSANLDNRSFAMNEELNLVIYDPAIARRLDEAFADDVTRAARIDYATWSRRGLWARLKEIFVAPIQDLL